MRGGKRAGSLRTRREAEKTVERVGMNSNIVVASIHGILNGGSGADSSMRRCVTGIISVVCNSNNGR